MSVAAAVHGATSKRRWTPKELGTLSLWLDADDASTITIATGVSQWDDKSGSGNNVSQATPANQPEYVGNAQNGRAVVRFDGTNAFLAAGDVLDIRTGDFSIVAAHVNDTATTQTVITKTTAAISANGEWALFTGRGDWWVGGAQYQRGVSSTAGARVACWVLDRDSYSSYWANGTVATANFGTWTSNTDDMNTTAALHVGGRAGSTTLRLDGDICEIIVCPVALSTASRQAAEGYLAWKWGLVSSLPTDHPYKNIQP